jgi:Uncharacterised protein family (UPF0182)/SOS response associated peptidase (SRAP)
MCGRYTMTVDQRTVEHRFGAKFISGHFEHYEPTYNAAPSQMLPIIRTYHPDRIEFAKWGLRAYVVVTAPFLDIVQFGYMVISEGRLFWMQDAYTTSRWFPYAFPLRDGGTNYIRNSVKVVIDAYNGTVHFYVVDPSDPVVATYQRIFPGQSRSGRCQQIGESMSATQRTSSSSRPRSIAPTTWTILKYSTTAKISGNLPDVLCITNIGGCA